MNFRCNYFFITIFLLLGATVNAYANPQGENVVAGTATFDRSTANTLTVNTSSNNTIINYNSFSIAANETTTINQPSASSAVLNRVVGVNPSDIEGTLSSNGKIFLVNPNGILFGAGASVNAPAIIASTLDITNNDFLNGNYNFFKNGPSSYIINQGRLAASPGGYIALLSQAVNNQGVILADLGSVALAAGNKMTLALDSRDQISVVIDEALQAEVFGPDGQQIKSAVQNSGTIQANGGKVLLTAKILNRIFDNATNNSGVVQANSLVNHKGLIELDAVGGNITTGAGSVVSSGGNITLNSTNDITIDGTISAPNGTVTLWTPATVNGDNATVLANNVITNPLDATVESWIGGNADWTASTANWSLSVIPNGSQYDVTIDNKGNPTVTISTAITVGDLFLGASHNATLNLIAGGSLTLTADSGQGTNGNLTIGSHGTLNAGAQAISLGGNWTNNGGTFNSGTSTVTFNAPDGNTHTIDTGGSNFDNVTFNDGGGVDGLGGGGSGTTWQLLNNLLNINGSLTVNSGNLDLNGKSLTVKGSFTNFDTVYNSDTTNPSTITAGRDFDNSNSTIFSSIDGDGYGELDLYFNASDGNTHTIDTGGSNFDNVKFNDSGAGTMWQLINNPLNVNGALTINGGTLNMGTNTLSVASVSNSGTIQTQNTSVTPLSTGKTWGGTVNYNRATGGQTVVAGTYNNLTLSNTNGTDSAGGNLTVNGALTTTSAGTFNMGSNTLNIGGTWTNGGHFTAGTGTVDYTTITGGQTIAGVTYNNLTLSNINGTDSAGGNLKVNGNLITTAGGTLNMGTFQLFGNFTPTNGGTLKTSNTSLTPIPTSKTWGGTVNYNRATGGQRVVAGTYNNLTLSNTNGTDSAGGNLKVNGNLITTAGGTLNMGTNTLSVASVSNSGTIQTQNTSVTPLSTGKTWGGTVNYNRATGGQRVVAGTYNNLTLSNTNGTDSAGGNLTVNGALTTTSAGTFNMGSNTLNIGGTWTNGGTFSAGSGTVNFNGSGAQSVGSLSPTTFNNLTINNASGATMSGDVTLNGTLNLSGGALNVGAHTLTLNGPQIVTPANLSTTSSSSLVFGGSSTGVGIPGSVTVLNSLTINNANNVILNSNITLTTPLTLSSGKLKITVNATANNKTYDGTTGATVTLSPNFDIASVVPTFNHTATFSNKNVGTGKTISVSGISLTSGASANTYTLSSNSAATTATITAAPLTITAATDSKTYNGTTSSTGTPTVSGLQTGDSVTGLAQAFNSKNVLGANSSMLSVTAGYTVNDGNSGNNYTVTLNTTAGTITAKALTESGLSVPASKVYDATTNATVSGSAALQSSETAGSGSTSDGKPYTGDTVSITGTATGTYNSKDVATASSVSFSGLSLTGAQAGDYSLTIQSPAAATITAKALTESGLSVPSSKVYDGTTTAVVSGSAALLSAESGGSGNTSDGKPYSGDTVSITGTATGTYNSKDVASASSVTFGGISLTGAQAGDYSLTIQSPSLATITAKALTVSGITANNKVFDGTTTATLNTIGAALVGVVGGDVVNLNTTGAIGAFDTPSVGRRKTVTVSGLTLTGIANIGSYALIEPLITGNIVANTNNTKSQIANSIVSRHTHNRDNLFFNALNPPATRVYFYHHLIDINPRSFDQKFQLDYGAYDFINGQIQKVP